MTKLDFNNANINVSVPFSLESLIVLDHSVNRFAFFNYNATSTIKYIVDNPGFYFLNSKKELKMWFELLRNIYASMSYIYDKLSSWYKEKRTIKKNSVYSHMPFARSKFVEGSRPRSGITPIEEYRRNKKHFRNFTVYDLYDAGILSQTYYHPADAIKAYVNGSKYTWPCFNMPKYALEEWPCFNIPLLLCSNMPKYVLEERIGCINDNIHLVLCRYHMYVISKYMEIIKFWLRTSVKHSNVKIIKLKK